MFDLSINPFPPTDRSESYEFTDELIPFISAPEYDCFRSTVEPNSRDFTKDVVEDISPMKEPLVLTVLPTHPTLQLNMKFQPSSESLFAYVVWIFLPFLVYSVVPSYLLSLRTEDLIFVPGIWLENRQLQIHAKPEGSSPEGGKTSNPKYQRNKGAWHNIQERRRLQDYRNNQLWHSHHVNQNSWRLLEQHVKPYG
nr:hypothetical protein [Tanacetum cinerariifolium]